MRDVERIWDIFFLMAPGQRECGIASIAHRWISKSNRKTGKAPAACCAAGAMYFQNIFGLAFDDFAGLDAASADAHALAAAIDLGLDGLQVYVPTTPRGVVGVRDVIAELRAFAAKITFGCHGVTPIFFRTERDFHAASGIADIRLPTQANPAVKQAVKVVGTRRLELLTSTVSR